MKVGVTVGVNVGVGLGVAGKGDKHSSQSTYGPSTVVAVKDRKSVV